MPINELISTRTSNCWPGTGIGTFTTTTPKWVICYTCKGEGVVGCCAGCTCLTNSKTCGICMGSGKVKNYTWNNGYTARTPFLTTHTSTNTGDIFLNQLGDIEVETEDEKGCSSH